MIREVLVVLDPEGEALSVRTPDGLRSSLAGPAARETFERMAQHVRVARDQGRSPGVALFGDLFAGPFAQGLDPLLCWAQEEPDRTLVLRFHIHSRPAHDWPLELVQHPGFGALGARPWCRVYRELQDDDIRHEALAHLKTFTQEALSAGHWEEAVCALRQQAFWLEGDHRGESSRVRLQLARCLVWVEGSGAAEREARTAEEFARASNDSLSLRGALRLRAELADERGAMDEADALLQAAIDALPPELDTAAEAEDRVWLVLRLFERRADREGRALVPAARRACRRAGRRDLEGRLDASTGQAAIRHGWEWPGRNLLLRGAQRLAETNQIAAAADAGGRLAQLLLRWGQIEQGLGAYAYSLATTADSEPPAEGAALEGLMSRLVRDVLPSLFEQGRPDLVAAFGLLLMIRSGAGRDSGETVPSLDGITHLDLVLGWYGRLFRLLGWIVVEGALVEERVSHLVAEKLNRRAWRLAGELERLSEGRLPTQALHAAAVRAAHGNPRSRVATLKKPG